MLFSSLYPRLELGPLSAKDPRCSLGRGQITLISMRIGTPCTYVWMWKMEGWVLSGEGKGLKRSGMLKEYMESESWH